MAATLFEFLHGTVYDSTALSSGPGNNTKSAWTQLIASTARQYDGLLLTGATFKDVSALSYFADIGIGGAGAETVLLPNLCFQSGTAQRTGGGVLLPIRVAAGSRLSMRVASSLAPKLLALSLTGITYGSAGIAPTYGRCTDYGTSTGTTTNTQIDPGGTVDTKGAWTQIVASTTNAINWLVVNFTNRQNIAMTTCVYTVDIATGASGSEVVLVPDLPVMGDGASDDMTPQFVGFPCDIPAGTRIAVRAKCSTASSPTRFLGVTLYGFDQLLSGGGSSAVGAMRREGPVVSIPQSAAYTANVKAFLSSDHTTPATGKTLAVTISKAGAAFGNPSAGAVNATEVGNGWYSYALSTTDTGTVGDLVVRLTGSGVDDAERTLQVVNAATGGLGNLDAAVSSRSTYAGADTAGTTTLLSRLTAPRATNLDNLDAAVSSRSTYAGTDTAGTTTLVTRLTATRAANLDNLDALVSSRLASAGYTLPLDAAGTRTAVGLAVANLDTQLSGINAKTAQLTFTAGMNNANLATVNGTTVTGSGTALDPWGP